MTDGVKIYGGFAATETLRSQRNYTSNVTVLSGDIDHETMPDQTDSSGVVTQTNYITGSYAYHVISNTNVLSTAVLDGFTLTAGQSNGSSPHNDGGGMYNRGSSSPSLSNLSFSGNFAAHEGGGIYNQVL